MKVLLLSLFHPELIRGGAQQICYELFEGLKETPGVEPVLLASVDQSYPALFKSGARITGFDGRPGEYVFLSRDYDHWWHKVGSALLVESYADFLRIVQPDVVHFHHFLTFGIDLITLTRRVLPKCKIVFTFHEFLAICLADGHMRRKYDGSLCTRSSPIRCHQCFSAYTPESFFLRDKWVKKHLEPVDVFTVPSRFMIERYVQWGLPPSKIVHIPNGQKGYARDAATKEEETERKPNRFGFFGQLVDSKGVHILLEAVQLLRAEGFEEFAVDINGDNLRFASEARKTQFEQFIAEESARPVSQRNVFFRGAYHPTELPARMARIDWCIVPSIWEETFCLVISEAWSFGRPVIASNCGAMAERVRHLEDGLLFPVGDARGLAQSMRRACEEPGLWNLLARGINLPPARDLMVSLFCQQYGMSTDTVEA